MSVIESLSSNKSPKLSSKEKLALELSAGPTKLLDPPLPWEETITPLEAPLGNEEEIQIHNPNIVELTLKLSYNLENPVDMRNFARDVASTKQPIRFEPIIEEDPLRGKVVMGGRLYLNGVLYAEKRAEGISANASWDQVAVWAEQLRTEANPNKEIAPNYTRVSNISLGHFKRGQIGKAEKVEIRALAKEGMKITDIAKKFRRKVEAIDDVILNLSV